jgi:hypothetical protein
MIVRRCRGRCRVGRRSRATNCSSVPLPLIAEWGCARRCDEKSRRLSDRHTLADGLRRDGRGRSCATVFGVAVRAAGEA